MLIDPSNGLHFREVTFADNRGQLDLTWVGLEDEEGDARENLVEVKEMSFDGFTEALKIDVSATGLANALILHELLGDDGFRSPNDADIFWSPIDPQRLELDTSSFEASPTWPLYCMPHMVDVQEWLTARHCTWPGGIEHAKCPESLSAGRLVCIRFDGPGEYDVEGEEPSGLLGHVWEFGLVVKPGDLEETFLDAAIEEDFSDVYRKGEDAFMERERLSAVIFLGPFLEKQAMNTSNHLDLRVLPLRRHNFLEPGNSYNGSSFQWFVLEHSHCQYPEPMDSAAWKASQQDVDADGADSEPDAMDDVAANPEPLIPRQGDERRDRDAMVPQQEFESVRFLPLSSSPFQFFDCAQTAAELIWLRNNRSSAADDANLLFALSALTAANAAFCSYNTAFRIAHQLRSRLGDPRIGLSRLFDQTANAARATEVELQKLLYRNLDRRHAVTGNTLATDLLSPLCDLYDIHLFVEVRATEATRDSKNKMASDDLVVLLKKGVQHGKVTVHHVDGLNDSGASALRQLLRHRKPDVLAVGLGEKKRSATTFGTAHLQLCDCAHEGLKPWVSHLMFLLAWPGC